MDRKVLDWLYRVPGRKKAIVLALMLVQALNGASGVLYALILKDMVNGAAAGDRGAFWQALTAAALLVCGQLALRALLRFLNELGRSGIENAFKERLLTQILKKDYAIVSAVHSGEWMNRLTNDTVLVANGYVEILPGLCGMAVKLVSAMVMIVILEPRFGMVLVPGGLILVGTTYVFRRFLKRLHKKVQEMDGRLRVFLQERIGSMMIIRSFAAEEQTRKEAEERMRDHQQARMRKNHFSNLCNVGFGAIMNGMYLLGAGWCGYGILTGAIDFGTLTGITQLITQIQSPFANITVYLPRFYSMMASAERLMEIESYPDDCAGRARSLEEVTSFYQENFSAIELSDISFTYYPAAQSLESLSREGQTPALSHYSLTVRKGEITAFTGPSGCGKSTVLKVLMGIYAPDRGDRDLVCRDGERIPLTSAWHRLFAYVPQGNQLMSGTIREVVSFAAPEKSREDESLFQALSVSCAEDFVRDLDQGLDTLLGERGTGLSEGQMQRLAIARAIFSESPILLLDESTSALDSGTEKQLLQNLRRMTDKTVLIVTHRPAALEICDQLVREDGDPAEKEWKENEA